MPNLTILTSEIRQLDGLYSLNDLHKASGNELRHRPVEFLRIDQTNALIAEIIKGGDSHLLPVKTEKGRNGGTYVCKELVYAYAMWISAKFHLLVIRAFDAMNNPAQHNEAPKTDDHPIITAVQFNNMELSVIILHGHYWLSSAEIAKALGYKKASFITQTYNRNQDEFTTDMTSTVKLPDNIAGQNAEEKDTIIFSPRGCHLIGMITRTDRAKAFRRWTLDVLENLNHPGASKQIYAATRYISETQNGKIILTPAESMVFVDHIDNLPEILFQNQTVSSTTLCRIINISSHMLTNRADRTNEGGITHVQ